MQNRGRLIALEGSGGRSMSLAAKRMQRALRQGRAVPGISFWDASGIFFEIREGVRGIPGASPRTLILLYASDLAFRLRWEIRPALESGATVIAASYVESAIAFGRAAGIPRLWIKELFAFAPAPDLLFRVSETGKTSSQRPRPADSFLQFSFMQLRNTEARWSTEEMQRNFLAHLAGLEGKGKCRPLADVLPASAAAG